MAIWLQITSGRGPDECCWAVGRLHESLTREAADRGVTFDTLELVCGDKNGTYRSVLFSINGNGAEEFAREIEGSIQWIGESPFRPRHKRKNWFVGVESVPFPDEKMFSSSEIKYEATRASGPGGQHVNKTQSAIRATHIPTGLTTVAQEERSQMMNKRLALARLIKLHGEKLASEQSGANKQKWAQHNDLERGNPVRVYKGRDFKLNNKVYSHDNVISSSI